MKYNDYKKPIPIAFDSKYFEEINTPNKSYWLGFIFADGNVYNKTFKLKLATIDRPHIEAFKTEIKSQHNIYYENNNTASYIRICSIKLYNDLVLLGCVPNKSLILAYPAINQFNNDFIRGYFDGDGCFYQSAKRTAIFSIVSGSRSILESIRTILEKDLNIKIHLYQYTKNRINPINALTINRNNDLIKLYHYLYDDSLISLLRKQTKFLNYIYSL
jgi:hypothetical protein